MWNGTFLDMPFTNDGSDGNFTQFPFLTLNSLPIKGGAFLARGSPYSQWAFEDGQQDNEGKQKRSTPPAYLLDPFL